MNGYEIKHWNELESAHISSLFSYFRESSDQSTPQSLLPLSGLSFDVRVSLTTEIRSAPCDHHKWSTYYCKKHSRSWMNEEQTASLNHHRDLMFEAQEVCFGASLSEQLLNMHLYVGRRGHTIRCSPTQEGDRDRRLTARTWRCFLISHQAQCAKRLLITDTVHVLRRRCTKMIQLYLYMQDYRT